MKKRKGEIYYYSSFDEDVQHLKTAKRISLSDDYVYERKNPFFKIFSFILYWIIAKPILALVSKIRGISVKNRKNIKKLKGQGFFIYGNHTSNYDAFTIQALAISFTRVNAIGYSDALSMPVIKYLVKALGLIPLGDSIRTQANMMKCIKKYIDKKQAILIFPEAHDWPYYTHIRPFKDGAFHYPAKFNAPIIPFVTIMKERKIFKNLKPKMDIVFLDPIYPKKELNVKENKEYLANECFKVMSEYSNSIKQPEFFKFIKKEKNNL